MCNEADFRPSQRLGLRALGFRFWGFEERKSGVQGLGFRVLGFRV